VPSPSPYGGTCTGSQWVNAGSGDYAYNNGLIPNWSAGCPDARAATLG
jgi:hypothetical protein